MQQVGVSALPFPRIHLIAPAGPCTSFYRAIGVASGRELVAIVQEAIGNNYEVTAQTELFDAAEDELLGGRTDDAERAIDIQNALADSNVTAIITLRGGAWFARIIQRIDFSVMDRRTSPVSFFGFSELTPLAIIIGAHANGLGYYDMGPVFLGYGLRRYAEANPHLLEDSEMTARDWMRTELDRHFREFFVRCVNSIEGKRAIEIEAKLLRGKLPATMQATFVGGNLAVLPTMVGTRYESAIDPRGKWLVLEDYNDKPERFDRFLAHFSLAGYFDRCEGVLLGDFHWQQRDLVPAIVEMLRYHTPKRIDMPILHAPTIGHTWPMDTLPLHLPATVTRTTDERFVLRWAYRRIDAQTEPRP
jgi:muramoyltetrapeptide carboxypeptidase